MALAAPTYAECWTQMTHIIRIIMTVWKNGVDGALYSASANNLTGRVNTLTQALEGVYASESETAAKSMLEAYSDLVTEDGRDMLDPLIFEMGRAIGLRENNVGEILDGLYKYMFDNSFDVLFRNMTFGAVAAGGSNVGVGTVIRHTTDQFGNNIENASEGVLSVECVLDARNGSVVHQESWDIFGEEPNVNALQTPGKAGAGNAITAGPDISLLDNSDFADDTSAFSGSGPTSWTMTSGATSNIVREITTTYIGSVGVRFTGSDGMYQDLVQSISSDLPYACFVIWNRNGSSGTLDLDVFSNTSTSVTVSAQSGWQVLSYSGWYREFKQQVARVTVDWTQSVAGLIVDCVVMVPMDPTSVDGTYITVVPSSTAVQFEEEDIFTFTDNHADTGQIQFCLYLLYGKYLPYASSSPTVTEPAYS